MKRLSTRPSITQPLYAGFASSWARSEEISAGNAASKPSSDFFGSTNQKQRGTIEAP